MRTGRSAEALSGRGQYGISKTDVFDTENVVRHDGLMCSDVETEPKGAGDGSSVGRLGNRQPYGCLFGASEGSGVCRMPEGRGAGRKPSARRSGIGCPASAATH